MPVRQLFFLTIVTLSLLSRIWAQGNSNPSSPRLKPGNATKSEPPPSAKVWKDDELDWIKLTDANGNERRLGLSKDAQGQQRVEVYIGGDGRVRRRDPQVPFRWKQFDNVGRPIRDDIPGSREVLYYFGDFELVRGRDVKMVDIVGNQIRLFKLDGTWELILGASDVGPDVGLKTKPDVIEMTVRYIGSDRYEVIDHKEEHRYFIDAFLEADRLTFDNANASLTYHNRAGKRVTVYVRDDPKTKQYELDKRIVLMDNAAEDRRFEMAGLKFDSAGRLQTLFGQLGRTEGEYAYQIEEGQVTLYQFRNAKGLWLLDKRYKSNEQGRQQRWKRDGSDGVYMFADSIGINRDGDMVIIEGDKRLVHKTDGSTVQTVTNKLQDGKTETTVSVGNFKQGKFDPAYFISEIRDTEGGLISKSLQNLRTRYVTKDGIAWTEADAEGKPVAGTEWFGDIQIVDSPTTMRGVSVSAGTLVKTSYVTELRQNDQEAEAPESKPELSAIDANGGPIFKELAAIDTSGWTVRVLPNGGKVVHFPDKTICEVEDAVGRRTRFHYEKDSSGNKTFIRGIAQYDPLSGSPLYQWVWQEQKLKNGKSSGHFTNEFGDLIFMKVSVSDGGDSVTKTCHNEFGQQLTITYLLDGRTRIRSYDGAITERDGLGRVIYYRHGDGRRMHVEYARDSELINRIDWLNNVYLRKDVPAEVRQDVPKDAKVIEVDELELEDAAFPARSDYELQPVVISYVMVRDGVQVRKRVWLDFPETEHGIYQKQERLIRSVNGNGDALSIERNEGGEILKVEGKGFVVVAEGTPAPDGALVARENPRPKVGEDTARIVVTDNPRGENTVSFFNDQGLRVVLHPNGAQLLYAREKRLHARDNLVSARDGQGHETKLKFDDQRHLETVESDRFTLRSDGTKSEKIAKDSKGQLQRSPLVRFELLQMMDRPVLKLVHQQGSEVCEYFDLVDGRREVRTREGSLLVYDDQDRLQHDQDNKFVVFDYYYWNDGTALRFSPSLNGSRVDLDTLRRVTYEKDPSGKERYVTYGEELSRRELFSDKSVRQFDKQGRVLYQRDAEGNAQDHFYLDNGQHVVREYVDKGEPTDQKREYITTTFEPDPSNGNQERLIHYELPSGLFYATRYKDKTEDYYDRISLYVVGNDKKHGSAVDSLAEFDPYGRLTYRRTATGEESTFYYSKTPTLPLASHDLMPHTVVDSQGKWLRAGDIVDADGNYEWSVTKNERQSRAVGVFTLPIYDAANPFRSVPEVKYSFNKRTTGSAKLLAAGQDKLDYGNGIRVLRQPGDLEIVEITNAAGKSQRYMQAAQNAKLPEGVQSIRQIRALENGDAEMVYHDGKLDHRRKNGLILQYGADKKLFGIVAADGSRYATEPLRESHSVAKISLQDERPVLHFADGHFEAFGPDGDRLVYAGDAGELGLLRSTTSADGKTSMSFQYDSQKSLNAVVRTTSLASGEQEETKFVLNSDGYWKHGEEQYDILWNEPSSGKTVLLRDRSRLEILPDGTEREIVYGELVAHKIATPIQVERDAQGRVKHVNGPDATVTAFVQNEQGEIVSVLKGDEAIVKHADGTWRSSLRGDLIIRAELTVRLDGSQIWKSENGTRLTVNTDNSLHLQRPDGSGFRVSPDRLVTRHHTGPANPVNHVLVYKDGPTIFTMKRGQSYKYNSSTQPSRIRFEDPGQNVVQWMTGVICLSPSATLTAHIGASPHDANATGGKTHLFRRSGDILRATRSDSPSGVVWEVDGAGSLRSLRDIAALDPEFAIVGVDGLKYSTPVSFLSPALEELGTATVATIARRYGVDLGRITDLVETGILPAAGNAPIHISVAEADKVFFDQAMLQRAAVTH